MQHQYPATFVLNHLAIYRGGIGTSSSDARVAVPTSIRTQDYGKVFIQLNRMPNSITIEGICLVFMWKWYTSGVWWFIICLSTNVPTQQNAIFLRTEIALFKHHTVLSVPKPRDTTNCTPVIQSHILLLQQPLDLTWKHKVTIICVKLNTRTSISCARKARSVLIVVNMSPSISVIQQVFSVATRHF